jgi:hypothetical protein
VLAAAAYVLYARADTTNVGELSFRNELRIPPLAEPSVPEPGRKVFDLELQEGVSELLPGRQAETWGVNGTYLADAYVLELEVLGELVDPPGPGAVGAVGKPHGAAKVRAPGREIVGLRS